MADSPAKNLVQLQEKALIRPTPARFSWAALAAALLVGPAIGLGWAWTAEALQDYFAPPGIFPLLIGVFCGLTVVVLVRYLQFGHRQTIFLAVVLTALVAAVGREYLAFRTWCCLKESLPIIAPGETDTRESHREQARLSFDNFLRDEAQQGRTLFTTYADRRWAVWLSCAIEGLLLIFSALAVSLPAVVAPYCGRCGSWYRTEISIRLDPITAERLATLIDLELRKVPRPPRCRLSICQGRCGPARLELSWERAYGTVELLRLWLEKEQFQAAAALLENVQKVVKKKAGGNVG